MYSLCRTIYLLRHDVYDKKLNVYTSPAGAYLLTLIVCAECNVYLYVLLHSSFSRLLSHPVLSFTPYIVVYNYYIVV